MSLSRVLPTAVAALVVVALAGCATTTANAHLQWSDHPEHGEILTDSDGYTLYLFTNDEDGQSSCYGTCAENWPPLLTEGEPTADEDVMGILGTTERDDGALQVTFQGDPLYYFASDDEPGQANGHGIGDVWFVIDRA